MHTSEDKPPNKCYKSFIFVEGVQFFSRIRIIINTSSPSRRAKKSQETRRSNGGTSMQYTETV